MDNVIIIIILIIWLGKVYNKLAIIPLYLYVKKIDDKENPTKNPFIYVRNIFIIIPIIINPSIHIMAINI